MVPWGGEGVKGYWMARRQEGAVLWVYTRLGWERVGKEMTQRATWCAFLLGLPSKTRVSGGISEQVAMQPGMHVRHPAPGW